MKSYTLFASMLVLLSLTPRPASAKSNGSGVPYFVTGETSAPPASISGRILYNGDQHGTVRVSAVPLWSPTNYAVTLPSPGLYAISNLLTGAEMLVATQANDFPLQLGQGFLVHNNQSSTQLVILCGDVLIDDFADVTVYPGLNLIGYPYAADVAWEDTTLAQTCSNGSWMYMWDSSNDQFRAHSKVDGLWAPTGTVLSAGNGFQFLNVSGSVINWREACPYSQLRSTPTASVSTSAPVAPCTGGFTVYASDNPHGRFVQVGAFSERPDSKTLGAFVSTNRALERISVNYLKIVSLAEQQNMDPSTASHSLNVVGYTKKSVPPGSCALLSACFDPSGGTNGGTVSTVLAWSLTGGESPLQSDQVVMFDGSTQSATLLWKDLQTNWWTWKRQDRHYGVFAYLDSNSDGVCNPSEAIGEHSAAPLNVTNDASGIDIRLLDPDSDSDLMPDWWEKQYGFDGSTNDAAADPDSDGSSNLAEYIAGTSPTNGADCLHIIECNPSLDIPDALTFAWNTISGRSYNVLTTTNLISAWTTVLDSAGCDIPGDGRRATYTNATPLDVSRFFRINVTRMPFTP